MIPTGRDRSDSREGERRDAHKSIDSAKNVTKNSYYPTYDSPRLQQLSRLANLSMGASYQWRQLMAGAGNQMSSNPQFNVNGEFSSLGLSVHDKMEPMLSSMINRKDANTRSLSLEKEGGASISGYMRDTMLGQASGSSLGAKPKKPKKNQADEDEELKTEKLLKTLRGILNKLTTQKFETTLNEILVLAQKIDTNERLTKVVYLIFSKAIDEPLYSKKYAELCRRLSLNKMPQQQGDQQQQHSASFRKLLLNKCQEEFEKNKTDELNTETRTKEIEKIPDQKMKQELKLLLMEEERRIRVKKVGLVTFIGELYKLKMLTNKIIHGCISVLLDKVDEESLECLCALLSTVGKELEHMSDKKDVDQYFQKLQKIAKNDAVISLRIRNMLQDVIELRMRNWAPHRNECNPNTMELMGEGAERETHVMFHSLDQLVEEDSLNKEKQKRKRQKKKKKKVQDELGSSTSISSSVSAAASSTSSSTVSILSSSATTTTITSSSITSTSTVPSSSSQSQTNRQPSPSVEKRLTVIPTPCSKQSQDERDSNNLISTSASATASSTSSSTSVQRQMSDDSASSSTDAIVAAEIQENTKVSALSANINNINISNNSSTLRDNNIESKSVDDDTQNEIASGGPDSPQTSVTGTVIETMNIERSQPIQLMYNYKEDQWSPLNTEGKKVYDHDFLFAVRDHPLSNRRPDIDPDVFTNKPYKPGVTNNNNKKKNRKNLHTSDSMSLGDLGDNVVPTFMRSLQSQRSTGNTLPDVCDILKKLPQKSEILLNEIIALPVDTNEKMSKMLDNIFLKAVDEPSFTEEYAELCRSLSLNKIPQQQSQGQQGDQLQQHSASFRKLLLNKCQEEFEKKKADESNIKAMIEEIDQCTDEEKKKKLKLLLDEEVRRFTTKKEGLIRFIGELYKLQMLAYKITHGCLAVLLDKIDEESLECLCKLLTSIENQLELNSD